MIGSYRKNKIPEKDNAELKDAQSSPGGTERPEAKADRLTEGSAAWETHDKKVRAAQTQEDYRRQ